MWGSLRPTPRNAPTERIAAGWSAGRNSEAGLYREVGFGPLMHRGTATQP